MTKIFGHRWASAYGEADDGTWLKGLAGVSVQQIANGLQSVIDTFTDGWPPSLPEFREICLKSNPALFGLPDVRDAYLEAARNSHRPTSTDWSHPIIYLAGRATGWFEIRNASPGAELTFARNFEVLANRAARGENLDAEIPLALEDTRDTNRPLTEHDLEVGREALEKLKGLV